MGDTAQLPAHSSHPHPRPEVHYQAAVLALRWQQRVHSSSHSLFLSVRFMRDRSEDKPLPRCLGRERGGTRRPFNEHLVSFLPEKEEILQRIL